MYDTLRSRLARTSLRRPSSGASPTSDWARGHAAYQRGIPQSESVASTEQATALSDRSWRDLLERLRITFRPELMRFNGREV